MSDPKDLEPLELLYKHCIAAMQLGDTKNTYTMQYTSQATCQTVRSRLWHVACTV